MRRFFLIDLENVQSAGLDGIDQLTEEDSILIFYSDKADNLKIELVRKILEGKASVEFVKANNGTPNALDFQLITYLFFHLEKDAQYWIVSKDTGYDAALKMSKRMGLLNVRRAPAIKNAVHFEIRANRSNAYRAAKAAEQEIAEAETETEYAEESVMEQSEPVTQDESIASAEAESQIAQAEQIAADETSEENTETALPDQSATMITFIPADVSAEQEAETVPEAVDSESDKAENVTEIHKRANRRGKSHRNHKKNSFEKVKAESEKEADQSTVAEESVHVQIRAEEIKNDEKISEPEPETVIESRQQENEPHVPSRAALQEILGKECNVATDPQTIDLVEDGLRKSENKGQFYQFFRRRLGAARGSDFYKSVRGQFDAMKKLV